MKTWFAVIAVIAAVTAPQAAPRTKKKAPVMKVEVSQAPAAAKVGETTQLSVQVSPPHGIRLNRYPGITLRIDGGAGARAVTESAFVGSRKPIAKIEEFGFETVDPLLLEVVPESGSSHVLEGTLSFFYCVKASGYCAPGSQKVRLPLAVK